MNNIVYNKFNNFKKCLFSELIGEIITKFEINPNETVLDITTKEGVKFRLDGGERYARIGAYLENKLEELNSIIGKKIISEEVGEDYLDGQLLFFYNINTLNKSIQIRFIGEDEVFCAPEVGVFKIKTRNEVLNHIEKGNKLIEEIKKDINSINKA